MRSLCVGEGLDPYMVVNHDLTLGFHEFLGGVLPSCVRIWTLRTLLRVRLRHVDFTPCS